MEYVWHTVEVLNDMPGLTLSLLQSVIKIKTNSIIIICRFFRFLLTFGIPVCHLTLGIIKKSEADQLSFAYIQFYHKAILLGFNNEKRT